MHKYRFYVYDAEDRLIAPAADNDEAAVKKLDGIAICDRCANWPDPVVPRKGIKDLGLPGIGPSV
jgi:hypothetical protein